MPLFASQMNGVFILKINFQKKYIDEKYVLHRRASVV